MLDSAGTLKHSHHRTKPSPTAQGELRPRAQRPREHQPAKPLLGPTRPPCRLDFPLQARIIEL